MNISENGINLIKSHEGLMLSAYEDTGGVWTIGYGHTKDVYAGQKITEEEAEQFLKEDLEWAEQSVNDLIVVNISQKQYDSLVSFVFNVGVNQFKQSWVLLFTNQMNWGGVREQFMRWVYDNGVKIQGLENRRLAEASLYDLGVKEYRLEIIDKQIEKNSKMWHFHREEMANLNSENNRLRELRKTL